LSVYLDASVLAALFVPDDLSERATAFAQANTEPMIISDYAGAEFASAVARMVRIRVRSERDARAAFAQFDTWTARLAARVEVQPSDIAVATAYLRRLDLTLRAPDAVNIAIAERLDSTLVTFDTKMAASARALGLAVAQV